MKNILLFIMLSIFPSLLFSSPQSKTLIVTGDKNYAPYTFLDEEGEARGMLVDMYKEWADTTDTKVRFELKNWVESIESIKNKQADIHSGVYYKSPNLFLGDDVYETKVSLFSKKSYEKPLSNQNVGVIEPEFANSLKKAYPKIKIILYDTYAAMFNAMQDDKILFFFDSTYPVLMQTEKIDIDVVMNLISKINKTVHLLQQERGASCGYISSDGKKFKDKRRLIIEQSDKNINLLQKLLENNKIVLEKFFTSKEATDLLDMFEALDKIRLKTDSLKTDFPKVYSKYTQIIARLLLDISNMSDKMTTKTLKDTLYSYSMLLMHKESIGQKRAALSSLFTKKDFSKEIYEYYLSADTQESIYLKTFSHMANNESNEYYAKQLSHPVINKVKKLQLLALEKLQGKKVKVDAEEWFDVITKKINLIQSVQDYLYNKILTDVIKTKEKDKSSYTVYALYKIVDLNKEYKFSMNPMVHDKELLSKINDGFSAIAFSKIKEIEKKWISDEYSSVSKSKMSKSVKNEIEAFPSRIAAYIYNLNEVTIENSIKTLLKNEAIRAIDIKDAITGDTFIKAYKNKEKIILQKEFPKNIMSLNMQEKPAYYEGELVGTVIIYTDKMADSGIKLTQEERAWIKEHKKLKVAGEMDWPPFDFVDEQGNYQGIAKEYLKKIELKTGLEFEMITGYSWNELLNKGKSKELDIMPVSYFTKDRLKQFSYTKSYINLDHYIFMREGEGKDVKAVKDLKGKRIAIIKGYATVDMIKAKVSDIELIEVENVLDGLNALLLNKADAIIEVYPALNYAITKYFISGIKAVAKADFEDVNLYMMARKDYSLLPGILQKAIDDISAEEKQSILQRWSSVVPAVKERKNLTLAVGFNKEPFMFGKTSKKGIELDLATKALAFGGYKVEKLYKMASGKAANILNNNSNIDVAVTVRKVKGSGLFYSDRFMNFDNVAITRKSDNIKIDSEDDLIDKKVVAWGDAYKVLTPKYKELFNLKSSKRTSKYVEMVNQTEQHKSFFSKKADVIIVDKTIFKWQKYNLKNQFNLSEEYEVHNIFPEKTYFYVAFRDEKLRDSFNEGLKKIKSEGVYEKTYQYYIEGNIGLQLDVGNLVSRIASKYIFEDDIAGLKEVLTPFVKIDILHDIDVYSSSTNELILHLEKEKDHTEEFVTIEKESYYRGSGNPLKVGHVKILFDYDKVKIHTGSAVPELSTFKFLNPSEYKRIASIYKRYQQSTRTIDLSKDEKKWLKEHPVIRFAGVPNWLPYETINEDKEHIGVVSEYLTEIENSLSIKFERVQTKDYAESIALTKNDRVDMITDLVSSDHKEHLFFTDAYIHSPMVIVMDEKANYVENITKIKDKKIAVLRGYKYLQDKYRVYDDIDFEYVDSVQEGLMAVSTGKVDAYLANSALASYHISNMGLSNIRVVGKTKLTLDIGFSIRKEYEPFVSIMNKALNAIDESKQQEIYGKWIKQKYVEKIDYTLIWQIIGAGLLILLGTIYWNRKMAKEIIQRKEVEKALHDSQEQFTLMVSNVPGAIYRVVNDSAWPIIYMSDEIEKITGYPAVDFMESKIVTFSTIMYTEDVESIGKSIQEQFSKGDKFVVDYRVIAKSGEIVWVRSQGQSVESKTGEAWIDGVLIDITEQKELEAEMKLSEERFHTLFDAAPDSISIIKDGKYIDCNKATLEIYGVQSRAIFTAETTPADYSSEFQKDGVPSSIAATKVMSEAIDSGYARFEWICKRYDNDKLFDAEVILSSIDIHGEPHIYAVVRDITERKKTEQELIEVHDKISDSIEYASLIQHALIPDNNLISKQFSDYFSIWQPKDVVGGDIYLFEELRDQNECLLMVIDCTGHGVPGAFVTMLVKAIERQIISKIENDRSIDVSPAWILSYFNKTMKKLLQQESDESISNAGFDGGIIYYNKKEQILKFAGAETPLFYIQDEELISIKGNRHSIGYKKSKIEYEFKEHVINVKEGMKFYLTTDGYLDQNGGNKGFPFGKKRFLDVIKEYNTEPFTDQKEILLNALCHYQGDEDRNDDVTLIGFEIKKSNALETIVEYNGVLTQGIIAHSMEIIESKISNMGIMGKVSTTIIELAQNMMHYGKTDSTSRTLEGFFEVTKDSQDIYYVRSKNVVSLEDKNKIESTILEIKSLDEASIRKRYRELRKSGENTHGKGGGIGFYEIAKLVQEIEYNFTKIDEDSYAYEFKAQIAPKKKEETKIES